MIDISIIVPVYKGNKYIEQIIKMINDNIKNLSKNLSVELILVNDYPLEPIKCNYEKINRLDIKVFQTNINRGIHGARVYGFKRASGKYIVFLDQDDKLEDNYLESQLSYLHDADAVICNGYHNHKILYPDIERQKKVLSLDKFIEEGNQICSPAQVLLKRQSIPQVWLKNIMKNNGADDYFLWICMHDSAVKFTINKERLFIHNFHGSNASRNDEKMANSRNEMCTILNKEKILSVVQENILHEQINNIKEDEKIKKLSLNLQLMDIWLSQYQEGKSIKKFFIDNHFEKVAVYGMGLLGNHLITELENIGITISYGIDKDAEMFLYEFPIYKPAEYLDVVDVIIVSTSFYYTDIKKELEKKVDCPIIPIQEIFMN